MSGNWEELSGKYGWSNRNEQEEYFEEYEVLYGPCPDEEEKE